MSDIEKQLDELEAMAIEKELIANLSTCHEAKAKNLRLAQSLREQAALLRQATLPKDVSPTYQAVE